MTRRHRRRTGRYIVAAVAIVAAGGAALAATGFDAFGSGGKDPAAAPDLPPATATVERQTLVDRQTENGRLAYDNTATLTGRGPGTLTHLPSIGSTVERGKALCDVDNAPIVLLYGDLPAYRALTPGTKGDDVKQFEKNLAELGYTGFTVDDSYTAQTAAAVKDWQDDLGLPKTGTVELGRVVYADGEVRVDTLKAAVGQAVTPGAELLTYTDTTRIVTAELDLADQRLAKKDATVQVTLPGGKKTEGTIKEVATYIDTSGGGGAGGGSDPKTKLRLKISLADADAAKDLDAASVKIAFTASQRENVLTVPIAALLAIADGGYGVQVVEGTNTRIIPVETGLFADGRVEVTGDGLTEGMTVGMPS